MTGDEINLPDGKGGRRFRSRADVERIAELEAALEKIASCEKVCDGDVVDIARRALGVSKR